MTKKMNADERKDLILAMTVNYYTKTVTPVSSAIISNCFPEDISSATIRNVFAELEEDGFLTHPHTSAGRVPTQCGYRYYVDHLMHEIQLLEDEKVKIKSEYEEKTGELEKLLEKTSQVISELTQYTSIISIDGSDDKLICRGTNFIVGYTDQDLTRIQNILTALEEKERLLAVLNKKLSHRVDILIGSEIPNVYIENCSIVISQYRIKNGMSGRMAVLGPTRMHYERVISALDYFTELMEEIY